jgi:uncharacterized protein (TIGR00730 family)
MAELTKVCVYCGSGAGLDPIFLEAACALGRALAGEGLQLIYGGASIGLMGALARSTLDAGGRATGIIPRFLQSRERPILELTEVIVTEDMHERKMLMYEHADAFVALPGGVGTLEELVEQITWAQLGRHQKPVLIANIGGFWSALLDLMQAMRRERFIRSEMEVSVLVADTVDAIIPMLRAAVAARPQSHLPRGAAAPLSRM